MKSVYIETTIPSFYYETRKAVSIVAWREITRKWWDKQRHRYRLMTSDYATAELALAPKAKADKCIKLLSGVPRLDEPAELHKIARYYIHHRLMPEDVQGDAIHLAFASFFKIDFLLTWNCRHLANANKIHHLDVLNRRLKLHVPIITTPLNLMEGVVP